MRKSFVGLLVAGLSLSFACSASAATAKPLVVLSLASYDHAGFPVDSVSFVKDSPEMPTWLSSLFRLYAEGRPVGSIDTARPWGAVIQKGEKLGGYAFVPVTSAQSLADDLSQYIDSTTEVGDGVYKVVGTEEGKTLYAKESSGWLFVSDSPECLANVPADPATLLGGMQQKYDVAVRLELKNVPERVGKEILTRLDETLGPTLRGMSSGKTVDILGKAAFALDEVILGWCKR